MKKITLISDTHSFLDKRILQFANNCDEVWHAGDFGYSPEIEKFIEKYNIKGVYGNIDGPEIRKKYPKINRFQCENIKVLMTHIGGYPKKYKNEIEEEIRKYQPDLYICGHSHILKVIPDNKYKLLHINPGAAGKEGFHQMRTIILLEIDESKIINLEVVELGKRAKII